MHLLDTCTLLWLIDDQESLSAEASEAISGSTELFLSSISGFEIAVKHHLGKLRLSHSPQQWVRRAMDSAGITEIPVNTEIAILSTELPPLHRDPCDRMIIATAQVHRLKILTPDRLIRAYPGIEVRW
jgi:PIN domain nuclease of toxin-antitoxin system